MNVLPFPCRQATDRKKRLHEMAAHSLGMWFAHIRGRGETSARTPEEFYGFRAEDVAEIHYRKRGQGRGFWYRLNDGRVVDAAGKPSETDRTCYPSAY